MRRTLIAAMALCVTRFYSAAELPAKPVVLGVELLPQGSSSVRDTAGWDRVAKEFQVGQHFGQTNPRSACPAFAAKGKTVFAVKNASAVSVALLREAGYGLVALTQWYYLSVPDLPSGVFGSRSEMKSSPLVSRPLWECIAGTQTKDPAYLQEDYVVQMEFDNSGLSEFPGKQAIAGAIGKVLNTGLVPWIDGDHYVKRRIAALYVIAGKEETAEGVADKMGVLMDRLKLSTDYRAPELARIACSASDTPHVASPRPAAAHDSVAKPESLSVVRADSSHSDSSSEADTEQLGESAEVSDSAAGIAEDTADHGARDTILTLGSRSSSDTSDTVVEAGVAPIGTSAKSAEPMTAAIPAKVVPSAVSLETVQRGKNNAVIGTGLLVTGILLDYGSTMSALAAGQSENGSGLAGLLVVGLASTALQITGASLACAGASTAEEGYASATAGPRTDPGQWGWYAGGWGCAAVGTVFNVIGTLAGTPELSSVFSLVFGAGQDVFWTVACVKSVRYATTV
jgi:hypothetical protein